MHTSFQSLKANFLLSCGVALTGIAAPIALSYTLQELLHATPVQAFAAGAALCSTSLGTTFTVLASSGLSASRLGVVLTSAAMMDDVVGLVMVQVISNLGGDGFRWVTVVRPVLVSIAFAVIVPLICLYVARPVTLRLNAYRTNRPAARLDALLIKPQTVFFLHTILLIAMITGATYAGTSNLFAAYIAGATISWWDSELPHPSSVGEKRQPTSSADENGGPTSQARRSTPETRSTVDEPTESVVMPHDPLETRGSVLYQRYYQPAVSKILQPLFFASIGFSIPITHMFSGSIVWRGIVYTVLMAFAKLVCGLWLLRSLVVPGDGLLGRLLAKVKLPSLPHLCGRNQHKDPAAPKKKGKVESRSSPSPPKPVSLQPALLLALAMCARGEIGFLISGVAESNGIFSASGVASADEPSAIFLVVTWAIVLCTILGPLGVGLCVRRVKKLEEGKNQQQEGTGRDVLGVWGVQ